MTDSHKLSFSREPKSVPVARAALDRFKGEVPASALYDASLCLSELVTNAVQHPDADAGAPLELHLCLTDGALRVDVVDPGGGFHPGEPTEGNDGDEGGWGLFIVSQLATRWGAEPSEDRTTIWFEIARAEAAADGAAAGVEPERQSRAAERRDEMTNAVTRLRLKPAID